MNQFRELSYLGFRRFSPHPTLRAWVQCYWSIDHPALISGSREYLYPDGGSSLVFDLAPRGSGEVSFDSHQLTRSVCFLEPNTSFGIRFHPGAAFQLFRLQASEVMGGMFSASEIGLDDTEMLYDALLCADEIQRVQLIDDWLCAWAVRSECRPGLVEKLLPRLGQAEGSVAEALLDIGAGRRTVERVFRERVGVSPGQLKAWARVRLARQLIKSQAAWPLAQIGAACGYHDQSHFNRQFERVTGFTPGRYRERQLERQLG